ncbi:hypothetical protein MKQ68_23220 [Chitinophaga horti]|uniref:Tetratricopeptide repeat protein n=1 Tax=Chitinophaga horti TaxID=2920382 RepID=A0ABY6J0E7_9BACT|nr:hypothetical protein [Chitinophaga horti]UYQ92995.1 hypothetical protein MKQ68_23220 [Chitinophaga horti]
MKCIVTTSLLLALLPVFANAQMQDPVNPAIVMEYMQSQLYDQAAIYLKERVEPDNAKQLSTLGYCYYMSAQFSEAETTFHQVLSLDSNSTQAHFYLGGIQMQRSQPEAAVHHYFKLIALQPGSANYHKLLSHACAEAKKPDSAFTFLKEAARLNPKDAKTIGSLGNEYVDRKMYVQADSVLNTFLAMDSTQFQVTAAAVRSAYFQRQYKRVTTIGNYLMQSHVMSPLTFTYVSAAAYYDRQYELCIRTYEYLQLMNQAPEMVLYYGALAHSALKQYDKSNDLLNVCVNLAKSKNLEDYYGAMADNYEKVKQYKTAIAYQDSAYYLFRNPQRQYAIGRIYDAYLGNTTAARKYYHQYFVRAKPEDAQDSAIHRFVRDRMKQLTN